MASSSERSLTGRPRSPRSQTIPTGFAKAESWTPTATTPLVALSHGAARPRSAHHPERGLTVTSLTQTGPAVTVARPLHDRGLAARPRICSDRVAPRSTSHGSVRARRRWLLVWQWFEAADASG